GGWAWGSVLVDGRDGRVALRETTGGRRQLTQRRLEPLAGVLQRRGADTLAGLDERHHQLAVVAVVARPDVDPDDLGLGDPAGRESAQRGLAAAHRGLVLALLRDAHQLT